VRNPINLKFAKELFKFQEEKIRILAKDKELPPHMKQELPQRLLDMEKKCAQQNVQSLFEFERFVTLFSVLINVLSSKYCFVCH
jgi:hypothetical protein